MDSASWAALISGLCLITVAFIEALAARGRKKAKGDQERNERRAADRAEESGLSMRMMDASLELGLATALAVEQHKLNGEMKAAREKADKAREAYHAFLERISSRQLAKK